MIRRRLGFALLALVACKDPGAGRPSERPADEAAQSVRPGVNDGYRKEGALELWIDRFERERREVVQFKAQILAELRVETGMRVADIGAGTGLYFAELSEAVGPDGKVYATDIIPAFLDRLRARAAEEGLDNVEVIEATALDPRLPLASVDLVFLCDVYHHIEYPAEYMRAVLRVLEPGAQLVVIDFERIEGVTSKPMLKHIRAPKEAVIEELRGVGFEYLGEAEVGLEENYFLRFRRPPTP